MEDAEARDLRLVCEFVLRLSGADLRRLADVSALGNVRMAARSLLTALTQPPQPTAYTPKTDEIIPPASASLGFVTFDNFEERCAAIEARLDVLECERDRLDRRCFAIESRQQGLEADLVPFRPLG